jgi:4-alpha-glucanotransferase
LLKRFKKGDTGMSEALTILRKKVTARQWSRVGQRLRAGIVTPLSAVKSRKSLGVGEINDMKLLIDWCVRTGNTIIQLLPLNEMHYKENSPYSALSVFAIDPVYISLSDIESFKISLDANEYFKKKKGYIESVISAERVNFREIRTFKLNIMEILFHEGYDEEEFYEYLNKNSYWIDDYALFASLKVNNGRTRWYEWERPYRDRDRATLDTYKKKHEKEILFYKFVQWHLYKQLQEVKSYGLERDVHIMGDLPILVDHDSADVWAHKKYFKADSSAGAPPDMYSATGQKWDLPPYNWEILERDDYRWWKQRLAYAQNFYDMFRLDHIVGFFRIFTVPSDARDGLEGFYDPQDENLWQGQGEKLLKMLIDSTDMLIVGEDLGTIPDCCRKVMNDLGIPGFKIERWEKDYQGDGHYIHPADYNPISLASLSTHDSETLREWWLNSPEERKSYCSELGLDKEPQELTLDIEDKILNRFYNSSSIFVILGLWDILTCVPDVLSNDPAQNRVNVPAVVSDRNWSLRFNFFLEETAEKRFESFNKKIRAFIVGSKRA